ncbi:phenoloxidase-activating enzyme-like isoform X1 [Aricia agestis]|uniref:phenoloxidase-activating enzyme-like isoform X1 n=1 Tax=Aricia agestis TaxID=91739 RepID=UPI001C2088D7|nr:phenoloxidase-activating enzyme-like isoform X1 [Aricia agestis]
MYKLLLVAFVCLKPYSYGDNNMCKIPNGGAGTCVNILRCRPLNDIHNKRRKTQAEDTFLRQSLCGYPNSPTIYVCCPSIDTWHNFEAKPVIFHNPLDDLSGDTYYPTNQANFATETAGGNNTIVPNSSPTPSQATPVPITTITETEPKINKGVPLSRDYNTDSMSNTNDEDDFFSLSISNRNNKMTCGYYYSIGDERITGGDATSIDAYPWLVLLEYNSNVLGCGGSLITSRFVLTAAHCANSRANGIPAFVRLSEYNTTSFPTDFVITDGGGIDVINVTIIPVEKVWAHPSYKHISFLTDDVTPNSFDIGLVKLTRDVEFGDFIDIICLPPKDFVSEFKEGLYLTVAGWGEDALNPESDVKKDLKIPYVPLEKCRSLHSRTLVDNQLCAGGETDKDTCVGDSGGPLMYSSNNTYYLVGIVSYGSVHCGTKGQPGIYTNVHNYLKWISDVINSKE